MDDSLSRRLAQGAALVVVDRLAALQLESYLSRASGVSDRGAWPSADIRTRAAYCADVFAALADDDRLLLSATQSAALWQEIVAESKSGAALLDVRRIAEWARDAWRLLHDWRLDVHELRARDDDPGFEAFLDWAGRYARRLAENGWLDTAELPRELSTKLETGLRGRGDLVWADWPATTPVNEALTIAAQAAGCTVSSWAPAGVTRSACKVAAEDQRDELRRAAAWARRAVAERPSARVALVAPWSIELELELARCFETVDRANSAAALSYTLLEGRAGAREPALGAALDFLSLFSRQAEFRTLSRWMRSPFFGGAVEPLAERCMAEAQLRNELVAQLGFLTAYRSAGLGRWLAERLPLLGGVIDAAIAMLDRTRVSQSPTRWTAVFHELLETSAWPNPRVPIPGAVPDVWQRAVDELASLTPVVGAIGYERALSELSASVSRAQRPPTAPLSGVIVLSRIEDLGPGYDAAWITGMTDRAWPRPAEANPLPPHALQAAHGMPFATPADSLARARALTSRLIERVADTVFSYPRIEDEFAAEPSPLLRGLDSLDAATFPAADAAYAAAPTDAPLEVLDDPVPAFSGTVVAGGAGTLATQARCPLRAYTDSRLGARALEALPRGLSPKHRGILVHRVLELLFAALPGKAQLAAESAAQLDARIRNCIDRALRERLRGARSALGVYVQIERDRLVPLVAALVTADLARSDFVIEKLELDRAVKLGPLELGCRIDRVDRLADRTLAIIDYKTGRYAKPAGWFKPRLVEPQLPLYLCAAEDEVGALVIGRVHAQGVAYEGVWQSPGAFPGKPYGSKSALDWPAQKARWAAQLEELAGEYAHGDGRIFLAERALAEGAYAPLTRIYEAAAAAGAWDEEERA